MSEWEYESKGGAEDFLKIKSGETVTIRIITETFYRQQVTKDGTLVDTREFKPEQWEEVRVSGEFTLKDRFLWGVWSRDDTRAYILEVGASIYNQVKDLAIDPEYGDPRSYDIKIKRTGEGLETKYSVLPGKNNTEITDEEGNAALDLNLENRVKGARPLTEIVNERK